MRKQYKGTKLKHVSKLVYKMKTHLHFNLINIHISDMKSKTQNMEQKLRYSRQSAQTKPDCDCCNIGKK